MDCRFITPITKEEVQLYLKFANTEDFNGKTDIYLIEYDSYREENEEYAVMPEWFIFENTYSGNNQYLLLPMQRTEREECYRKLWREEQNAITEKKYESGKLQRYIPDDRPEISIHKYADIERFIVTHESKDVLTAFRKHYAYFADQLIRDDPEKQEDGWLTERVSDIIHQLNGVKEKIPVEANCDWRQGLIDAFAKYERKKIKDAIPYAFDDYNMIRDLKINKSEEKYWSSLISIW